MSAKYEGSNRGSARACHVNSCKSRFHCVLGASGLSLSVNTSREGWLVAQTFSGERMLKMTRRIGRLSGLIAAGVAIVGTGSGVMAASYSAFSSTTANPTNSWNTGSVILADDDAGGAMFSGTNQQMNATGTHCIKVTSTGTLASTVKLYSTGYTDASTPTTLGSHIVLTIKIGSASGAGTFADCSTFSASSTLYTGTLAGFYTSYGTSYSGGLATGWAPVANAGTDFRVFQFIWSYDGTAPQSATASDTFTWEAQGS